MTRVLIDETKGNALRIKIEKGNFRAPNKVKSRTKKLNSSLKKVTAPFDDYTFNTENSVEEKLELDCLDTGSGSQNDILDDGDSDMEEVISDEEISKKRKKYDLPQTCQICSKVIIGKSNLQKHVRRTHIGEKNRKCEECSKHFFTNNSLKKHILNKHNRKGLINAGEIVQTAENAVKDEQDYLEIDSQDSTLLEDANYDLKDDVKTLNVAKKSRKPMFKNMKRKPPSYRRQQCKFCLKMFSGNSNIRTHIRRIHMAERSNKCVVCSKSFFTNASLESHMLTVHTRQCQACGQYVNESVPWGEGIDVKSVRLVECKCGNSVVVRRTHIYNQIAKKEIIDSVAQFACEYCGKVFKRKHHVLRHSKLHTDNVHTCDHCCRSFRTKTYLKKHLAENHQTLAYPCQVCSDSLNSSAELTVHMKAHETLGGDIASTTEHEEQSPTSTSLSRQVTSTMQNAAAAVTTVPNDMPETYTIQLVHGTMYDSE